MLNWGIIGLGSIANSFAEAFKEVTNANLLSISSKSEKRLKKFKEKFAINDGFCFSRYEDLINNSDVDIVYIALPHSFHFEWIIKCISKNKHVLCEKPALLKYNQIIKINKLLNSNKLFFSDAYAYSFHPQIYKTIEIIRNGDIGDLIEIDSVFGTNIIEKRKFIFFKKLKINENSRLFNKSLGGGSIFDLGCYTTSLSLLFSKIKSYKNYKNFNLKNIKLDIGPTGVDLEAFADLHFDNGLISKVGSSFKSNLGQKTTIKGTEGIIILPNSWSCKNPNILINNKKVEIIHKFNNILAYEIENISKLIINKSDIENNLLINRFDTEINTQILEKWTNNEK